MAISSFGGTGESLVLLAARDSVMAALASVTEQIRLVAVAANDGSAPDLSAAASLFAQKALYELQLVDLGNKISASHKV